MRKRLFGGLVILFVFDFLPRSGFSIVIRDDKSDALYVALGRNTRKAVIFRSVSAAPSGRKIWIGMGNMRFMAFQVTENTAMRFGSIQPDKRSGVASYSTSKNRSRIA